MGASKALGEQLWFYHTPCWATTGRKAGSVVKGDGEGLDTQETLWMVWFWGIRREGGQAARHSVTRLEVQCWMPLTLPFLRGAEAHWLQWECWLHQEWSWGKRHQIKIHAYFWKWNTEIWCFFSLFATKFPWTLFPNILVLFFEYS